jgi:DNA polymerase elongation subunit (family B)
MSYYLAVFFGCAIYILLQLNGVYNHPDFKGKTFLRANWIPTVLNLIIGCVLVFAKEDLANIYPITFVSALMLGVSGQALIKKLSAIFDSKVDTIVGL